MSWSRPALRPAWPMRVSLRLCPCWPISTPGELGEVRIRSDFLMNEYWNDPVRTSETLRGGWLYTGETDEVGYIYIVDRKKDLIISGGQNIVSKEIKDVIYEFPACSRPPRSGARRGMGRASACVRVVLG
jgi:acyl-CoA synthetase (AMP-forming)/AMP-acid ligase II